MIKVTISGIDGVQAELGKLADAPQKAVKEFAQRVHDLAEIGADKHTDTGALFRSLYLRSIPKGWEVGHDLQMAPHAVFVHWGTKPHVIRPKNRKALRWVPKGGGSFAFAKEVNHPGYKGDPWLSRAAADAMREFPAMVQKHLKGR